MCKVLSRRWIFCAMFWKIIILIWQQHPPSLPSMFPCHPKSTPTPMATPVTRTGTWSVQHIATLHKAGLHLVSWREAVRRASLVRCSELGWATQGAGVHYNASKLLTHRFPFHCQFVIARYSVRTAVELRALWTENFRGFLQSFKTDSKIPY
jgi:hypothetical protein